MPIPEEPQDQEFDRLAQRLRQHLDRRSLGRLAAGAAGTAAALHALTVDAGSKKKKKKGGGKKGKKKNPPTTPAPTTLSPTTTGAPTTSTTTTSTTTTSTTTSTTTLPPSGDAFVFDKEIGESALRAPATLISPNSVATDTDGNVYVLDRLKRQVIRFDPDGNNPVIVCEADDEAGVLTGPETLAVDSSGRLYVGDNVFTETDSYYVVQVFDASGDHHASLGTPEPLDLQSVYGIAIASDGRVFVSGNDGADEYQSKIFEWAPNFAFTAAHDLWDGWESIGSLAIDSEDRLYVVVFGSPPVLQVFSLGDFTAIATCDYSGAEESGFMSVSGVTADTNDNVFVVDSGALHRVIKLTWADATTLSYVDEVGTVGDGAEQFADPSGIAAGDGGKVYVADTSNARIQRLSNSLNIQMHWGAPVAGQFVSPSALALDSHGAIYVVDRSDNHVHKLDGNSTPVKWGGRGTAVGKFDTPTGIAIDSSDTLYVADQYNLRIQLFNANGNPVDDPWEVSLEAANIAIGPDEKFYVTDTSSYGILKLDDDGTQLDDFGDWLFSYPLDIAVGTNGTVYVADGDDDKVKRFESNGTPLSDWDLPGATGIAIDTVGRIFVSSYTDDRIHVLDANGSELFAFGTSGDDDGELDGPGALAFDAVGRLLIADESGRVQRFTPSSGRATSRGNGNAGHDKRANAKQKHSRKRKGGKNRDKRRHQRTNGPRGRGKGRHNHQASGERRQKGRHTRD